MNPKNGFGQYLGYFWPPEKLTCMRILGARPKKLISEKKSTPKMTILSYFQFFCSFSSGPLRGSEKKKNSRAENKNK